MDSECAMAYTEVVEILKYVPIEYLLKVPKEKIDFYKAYMDTNYNYKINKELDFFKQPISPKAKAVLANLFKDYWATTEEKEKILELERYEYNLIEEQKKKQYCSDNLFKKEENGNTSITKYKEENLKWYNKFIRMIKKIFRK